MPNINRSWIAVKGMDKAGVLETLGLVEAPEDDEVSYFRHSVAEFLGGWTVILALDLMYPTPARMAAVSVGGTAIACSIDERSMYSVARGYSDGQAVWSVDHDGGTHGPDHLDVAGKPPAELAIVRARLNAEQVKADADGIDVDYIFDVPPDLSLALCGYKFDPQREEDGPTFRLLDVVKTKGSGFLSKLFGKRQLPPPTTAPSGTAPPPRPGPERAPAWAPPCRRPRLRRSGPRWRIPGRAASGA